MERKGLKKAHEITDAKIQFVSLVDRAANAHTFLITKQEDGSATFTTSGRIIKADPETHYVTGIVYEPMTEDLQGDFMTEEEIEKACYWFAKNGDKIDLQHSFDPLGSAQVVENWVEKADTEINGEPIKKGTWLMTVEVKDDDIWQGIQKGEITGFSMGGQGTYSEEDVDLSTVQKTNDDTEKKGLLKRLGEALGIKVVEKGEVAEVFTEYSKCDLFWNAFTALEDALRKWNPITDQPVYETDEAKISEALSEFSEIVTQILAAGPDDPIIKQIVDSRPVQKAEPTMSPDNKRTLQGIYDSVGELLKSFDPEQDSDQSEDPDSNKNLTKEDTDMTRAEVEGIVQEAVEKAVSALNDQQADEPVEKAEPVTAESIQQMVDEAVEKAAQPQEEQLTAEQVQEMVTKAVDDAMQPLLKSAGLPSSLNDTVEKAAEQKQHYLHGIL